MRLSQTLRSTMVSFLLLGALGTGLPSHHHEALAGDADEHMVGADHHSHGTLLVEQGDRVQSAPPQLAMAPVLMLHIPVPATHATRVALREVPPPKERAPPPGAPRAPPLSV